MNFSLPFKKTPQSQGVKKQPHRFSNDDILVYGTIFIIIIFPTLIFLDGYIFYQTVAGEKETAVLQAYKSITLTPEDFDEIIMFLNERQKKFNEILELNKKPVLLKEQTKK